MINVNFRSLSLAQAKMRRCVSLCTSEYGTIGEPIRAQMFKLINIECILSVYKGVIACFDWLQNLAE